MGIQMGKDHYLPLAPLKTEGSRVAYDETVQREYDRRKPDLLDSITRFGGQSWLLEKESATHAYCRSLFEMRGVGCLCPCLPQRAGTSANY